MCKHHDSQNRPCWQVLKRSNSAQARHRFSVSRDGPRPRLYPSYVDSTELSLTLRNNQLSYRICGAAALAIRPSRAPIKCVSTLAFVQFCRRAENKENNGELDSY